MNERIYNGEIDRLRTPERVSLLEVDRVIENCLTGQNISTVLDVGTGTGLFAEKFLNRGFDVAAIDSNPAMVAATQKALRGLSIREASAEQIPFDDASFDLVFMGLVLHEVNDYAGSVKELYRVAGKVVCILEWEYKEQNFGPPIPHRLKSEFIQDLALKTGFKKVEIIKLENLLLYKLFK